MSRNFGLGSKPDKCAIVQKLRNPAYIPLCTLAICMVVIGLSYLFGG